MRLKLDMSKGGGCRDSVLIAAKLAYPNAAAENNVYTEDADTVLLWKTPEGTKIYYNKTTCWRASHFCNFSVFGAKKKLFTKKFAGKSLSGLYIQFL